jgi:hypothetical protein
MPGIRFSPDMRVLQDMRVLKAPATFVLTNGAIIRSSWRSIA